MSFQKDYPDLAKVVQGEARQVRRCDRCGYINVRLVNQVHDSYEVKVLDFRHDCNVLLARSVLES